MNRYDASGSGFDRSSTSGAPAADALASVLPGWDVYGSDEQKIGNVHDVGDGFLEVEKGLFFVQNLYIPASAVASIDADGRRVALNVTKNAVGDMGWTAPPLHEPGEERQTWGQGTIDPASTTGPRSPEYAPRSGDPGEQESAGRALAAAGAGADRAERVSLDGEPAGEAADGPEPVWKPAPGEDETRDPGAGAAEAFDGVAAAGFTSSTGIPPAAPRSVDADPAAGDADAALQQDTRSGPDASDGTARPHGW